MAYDERLAARVRNLLADEPALSERKMFGGLAFLLNGNMCCGIVGDGRERASHALRADANQVSGLSAAEGGGCEDENAGTHQCTNATLHLCILAFLR